MNIVFLGPQGSGKGTQASILAKELGYFYFEAGGFLRSLKDTDIPEKISKGFMVSGEEMVSLVKDFFEKHKDDKRIKRGIIFDGFPRTTEQYEAAGQWLEERGGVDLVFFINVSEKESIRRLESRVQGPDGKIYNLITNPPPIGARKKSLIRRADETPEAIRKRLDLYRQNTEPLIDVFRKEGLLIEIDGERPIDEIASKIKDIVLKKEGERVNE